MNRGEAAITPTLGWWDRGWTPGPDWSRHHQPPPWPLALPRVPRRWRNPVLGASLAFPRGRAPVKRETRRKIPTGPLCQLWVVFVSCWHFRGDPPEARRLPQGLPLRREWISTRAFDADRRGFTATGQLPGSWTWVGVCYRGGKASLTLTSHPGRSAWDPAPRGLQDTPNPYHAFPGDPQALVLPAHGRLAAIANCSYSLSKGHGEIVLIPFVL